MIIPTPLLTKESDASHHLKPTFPLEMVVEYGDPADKIMALARSEEVDSGVD